MRGALITFMILIALFYAVPQDWSIPDDFGMSDWTVGDMGGRVERTFDTREGR